MAKKTYKEMFSGPTGMLTAQQLKDCRYGGVDNLIDCELGKRFFTIGYIAESLLNCSKATARKKLKDVDQMVMNNDPFSKVYYDRPQTMKVIEELLVKKNALKEVDDENINSM